MKQITIIAIALNLAAVATIAGTGTLNDYNTYDVSIPDNGGSVNTDLSLSGAPSGAPITKVKVYYEIKHPRPSDLDVWLTCYDGGWQGDYFLHTQGSPAGVDRILSIATTPYGATATISSTRVPKAVMTFINTPFRQVLGPFCLTLSIAPQMIPIRFLQVASSAIQAPEMKDLAGDTTSILRRQTARSFKNCRW